MCICELPLKLKASANPQVNLTTEHAEVTEASEASEALVSTRAYRIMHKQYD